MDYQSYVEQSAAHVLANHELLMATPSASRLTSFYPTPSESQNTIAQAVCNSGQLTVQANSKNFGQSSDFIISSPNLMDTPHLRIGFEIPAYTKVVGGDPTEAPNLYAGSYHVGWGFDCIEQIEITFANSNISNLQVTGHAMRAWSLLQCKDEEARKKLLHTAGPHKISNRNSNIVMEAVVPLSFLFWRSAGGVKGGFPIDGRALNGPIIFRIRFAPLAQFFGPCLSDFAANKVPDNDYPSTVSTFTPGERSHGGVADFWPGGSNAVNSFSTMNLTFRSYQLMDGAFSVSKALEANPGFVYSLPSLWLNSYSQQAVVSKDGVVTMNLNSAPAGMIQAMILRIRPVNADPATAAGATASAVNQENSRLNYNQAKFQLATPSDGSEIIYRPYVPWSLPLSALKLSYSGQAIFDARSESELDQFYRDIFNGDDLKTGVCGLPLHLSVRRTREYMNYQTAVKNIATPSDATKDQWRAGYHYLSIEDENEPNNSSVEHQEPMLIIPLMHDGTDVLRKRGFENLPHYSGSTLQLEFTIKPYNVYKSYGNDRNFARPDGTEGLLNGIASNTWPAEVVDAYKDLQNAVDPITIGLPTAPYNHPADGCHAYPSNRTQHARYGAGANTAAVVEINNPNAEGAVAFNNSFGTVTVDVTYVVAALFQVTNGVAELQL